MNIITRRLEFDAGHRLHNHEGKCKFFHGHRYAADLSVTAAKLDTVGRVIDFSIIKEKVGGWIDANWDHNILLHPEDSLLKALSLLDRRERDKIPTVEQANWGKYSQEVFAGRRPFIMPKGYENPTAENMSDVLLLMSRELLPDTIHVRRVKLWETPNCSAICFESSTSRLQPDNSAAITRSQK